MNKTQIIGLIALGGFLSILFSPMNSDFWKYSLIVGAIFGGIWFWKN